MTIRKVVEGPSTRICRTKDCGGECSGRRQFCDACRKVKYNISQQGMDTHHYGDKVCGECKARKGLEEFIESMYRNGLGYTCARYGKLCDDCRIRADWLRGMTDPDVSNQPPYEAAKRLLAYEFRLVPSEWINRSTPLSRLHHLLMCKIGKIRDEKIDLLIADQRDIIRRYGPV